MKTPIRSRQTGNHALLIALLFAAGVFAGSPCMTGMTGMPDFAMGKGQTVVLDYTNWWEDEDLATWGYFRCTPQSSTARLKVSTDSVFVTFRASASWTGKATVKLAFIDDEMLESSDALAVTVLSSAGTGTAPYVVKPLRDTAVHAGDTLDILLSGHFACKGSGLLTHKVLCPNGKLDACVASGNKLQLIAGKGWTGTASVVVFAQNAKKIMVPDTMMVKVLAGGSIDPPRPAVRPVMQIGKSFIAMETFERELRFTNFTHRSQEVRIVDLLGRQAGRFVIMPMGVTKWSMNRFSKGIYFAYQPEGICGRFIVSRSDPGK